MQRSKLMLLSLNGTLRSGFNLIWAFKTNLFWRFAAGFSKRFSVCRLPHRVPWRNRIMIYRETVHYTSAKDEGFLLESQSRGLAAGLDTEHPLPLLYTLAVFWTTRSFPSQHRFTRYTLDTNMTFPAVGAYTNQRIELSPRCSDLEKGPRDKKEAVSFSWIIKSILVGQTQTLVLLSRGLHVEKKTQNNYMEILHQPN